MPGLQSAQCGPPRRNQGKQHPLLSHLKGNGVLRELIAEAVARGQGGAAWFTQARCAAGQRKRPQLRQALESGPVGPVRPAPAQALHRPRAASAAVASAIQATPQAVGDRARPPLPAKIGRGDAPPAVWANALLPPPCLLTFPIRREDVGGVAHRPTKAAGREAKALREALLRTRASAAQTRGCPRSPRWGRARRTTPREADRRRLLELERPMATHRQAHPGGAAGGEIERVGCAAGVAQRSGRHGASCTTLVVDGLAIGRLGPKNIGDRPQLAPPVRDRRQSGSTGAVAAGGDQRQRPSFRSSRACNGLAGSITPARGWPGPRWRRMAASLAAAPQQHDRRRRGGEQRFFSAQTQWRRNPSQIGASSAKGLLGSTLAPRSSATDAPPIPPGRATGTRDPQQPRRSARRMRERLRRRSGRGLSRPRAQRVDRSARFSGRPPAFQAGPQGGQPWSGREAAVGGSCIPTRAGSERKKEAKRRVAPPKRQRARRMLKRGPAGAGSW